MRDRCRRLWGRRPRRNQQLRWSRRGVGNCGTSSCQFMQEWVSTFRVREIDGQPCLVFTGASGGELYFPANRTEAVFQDAMRQFNAYAARHGVSAGQWRSATIEIPRTWNTGICDSGMAAIVVDKNLPSEQTFALLPEHAAALSSQLMLTTEQLGSIPSKPATKRKPGHTRAQSE